MEKVHEMREKAEKNLKIGNHLLTQSYPLVKDPKLLVAVLQNIFLATASSMTAILYYERENKSIPPFHDSFDAKFELFKKVAPKYSIPPDTLRAMLDMKTIITAHQEASVSFSRKDAFVICEEGYRLRTLTAESLKPLMAKAKLFIEQMEQITTNNTVMTP